MMALLAPRKPNVTIKNHRDVYYRTVWISKPVYVAVEFPAKFNRKSRKQVPATESSARVRGKVATLIETNAAES
jgi:hypothetical protein